MVDSPSRRAWLAAALAAVAATLPAEARAGKDCGEFAVIVNDGQCVFNGKQKVTIPAGLLPAGSRAEVRGEYVWFDVDLDTFSVSDYGLTGASARTDITGGMPTRIFVAKVPEHGSMLTGGLFLELNNEQLVLKRSGPAIGMKIQAKDCTQGGIFQMEPSRDVTYYHELDPSFVYGRDAFGRVIESNGVFTGRESPESASLVGLTAISSRWLVRGGGRMGAVLGEDALEP